MGGHRTTFVVHSHQLVFTHAHLHPLFLVKLKSSEATGINLLAWVTNFEFCEEIRKLNCIYTNFKASNSGKLGGDSSTSKVLALISQCFCNRDSCHTGTNRRPFSRYLYTWNLREILWECWDIIAQTFEVEESSAITWLMMWWVDLVVVGSRGGGATFS